MAAKKQAPAVVEALSVDVVDGEAILTIDGAEFRLTPGLVAYAQKQFGRAVVAVVA